MQQRWAGGEHHTGNGPDDVTTGSLPRLVRMLAALARVHALSTPSGQPPPLFLTEYDYVPCPLNATYEEAWRVFPTMLKQIVEPPA